MSSVTHQRWRYLALIIGALLFSGLLLLPTTPQGVTEPLSLMALPDLTGEAEIPIVVGALGDTGANTQFQKDVTRQMWAYHSGQQRLEAVLHLGDIIYPRGEIESYGQTHYINYYKPFWEDGVRFYPVLGNHDVLLGYREAMLGFYQMPNRYYHWRLNHGALAVDFYAIDTNMADDEQQLAWLKQRLALSTANWQVVYGHHPMVSSGAHGDFSKLKALYAPVFKQYGVDVYIAGHEHDYERFLPIEGTTHIISGGGGAYLRNFGKAKPGSVVRLKKHHFTVLTFGQNKAFGQAIDDTGTVLDRYDIPVHHAQP